MIQRLSGSLRPVPGWQRTLYILFAAQLITAAGFSSVNPFLPLYVESLNARTSLSVEMLSGLVFSAQAFTMMLASPIWGALADRYGRKLMVQRSMFGGACLILLMGFVRSAEELVLLRAIQGLITGTISAANALMAATAPRERTGYAMGMLQVGLFAGISLGPLIGGIIADVLGYRWVFGLTATLLALAGVLVWKGIRETFVATERSNKWTAFLTDWRDILAAPGVALTYSLRFLSSLARVTILPVMPLFVAALLPETAPVNTYTGLVIGLASLMSTATAIYLGRLGDRIGHQRVLTASAITAGLLYLPQSFVSEAWQLLILQALTGAAAGGIIPSLGALLARYTRPGEEGSVYGLDNSVAAAARTVAPLAGASVAVWFGLRSAFAVAGMAFLLVSVVAGLRLPRSVVQEKRARVERGRDT